MCVRVHNLEDQEPSLLILDDNSDLDMKEERMILSIFHFIFFFASTSRICKCVSWMNMLC